VKFSDEIGHSVDVVLAYDLGCGFCGTASGYEFVEFLRIDGKLPKRDVGLSILTEVWIYIVGFFLSSFLGSFIGMTGVLLCSLDEVWVKAVVGCGGGILLVTVAVAPYFLPFSVFFSPALIATAPHTWLSHGHHAEATQSSCSAYSASFASRIIGYLVTRPF
jgi:hypothetical protein